MERIADFPEGKLQRYGCDYQKFSLEYRIRFLEVKTPVIEKLYSIKR
jgi:hypothetical protein